MSSGTASKPMLDRPRAAGLAHRGPHGEVVRGDALPHGHDTQLGSRQGGQLVDRGPTGGEVRDHLVGDLGGVGRDSPARDVVPADEDQDQHALQPRRVPPLPGGQPDRQLLQPAQRPRGLGEFGVAGAAGSRRGRVGRRQVAQESAHRGEIGDRVVARGWHGGVRSL